MVYRSMNTWSCLIHLSDHELLAEVKTLAAREREATARKVRRIRACLRNGAVVTRPGLWKLIGALDAQSCATAPWKPQSASSTATRPEPDIHCHIHPAGLSPGVPRASASASQPRRSASPGTARRTVALSHCRTVARSHVSLSPPPAAARPPERLCHLLAPA
jgi:hypothetical protein